MVTCPFCNSPITYTIGRTTVCSKCNKELHSCICCKFYSPGCHWDCRESIDDPVSDKERGNFCDHFMLTDKALEKKTDKAEEARKKLEALFG